MKISFTVKTGLKGAKSLESFDTLTEAIGDGYEKSDIISITMFDAKASDATPDVKAIINILGFSETSDVKRDDKLIGVRFHKPKPQLNHADIAADLALLSSL